MIFVGAPFLRYVLIAIASILFSIYNFEIIEQIPTEYLIYSLVLFCFSFFIFSKKRTLISTIGYLIISNIFILTVKFKTETNDSQHISNCKEKIDFYKGNISNEPEQKDKTFKYIVDITEIKTSQGWKKASGKVLTYIYKDSNTLKPLYGDNILFAGTPELVSLPRNPGEFNLKRFYSFRQIFHTKFHSSKSALLIDNQESNALLGIAIKIRFWAEQLFSKYIKAERERKIASALILGIKGTLDWEIAQAYSNTGTMHVLAVSGLHVGIIYGILVIFCFWSKKIKYGRWIKAVFLLFALWFYALVTGLCPSILRSVTMFSFIIVAEAINRKSNIYNILAASCLFLLAYNPYMIMEVGFQLSYLAVIGIVYIHQLLYQLIDTKEWNFNYFKYEKLNICAEYCADWAWSISCVSVAAQLATFPLGILYFHQFPTYFIICNLAVIPVAIGIMWIGLVFVGLSSVSFIAIFLGSLIEKLVYFMNSFIFFTDELPFSVWSGLSITVFDTWHIYILIFVIFVCIESKKFIWFFSSVTLFIFLMISISLKIIESKNQHKITVYALNSGYAIDKFVGTKRETIIDAETKSSASKMQFHILNNRWNNLVSTEQNNSNLIQFYNKNILFVVNQQSYFVFYKKEKHENNIKFDNEICLNKYAKIKYDSCHYTSKIGAFTKSLL
ncbi:MAG: ComEC family competence protein [Cytophagales bacterium]|nr:MAG: ComEC family competence protein [Cytophagales bacterium]